MSDVVAGGKSAIVFGGSRGIGRTVTDFFVSAGYGVTIAARNAPLVEETVKKLNDCHVSQWPPRNDKPAVQGCVADIRSYDNVKTATSTHLKKYGSLDALINATGVQEPIGFSWQNDPVAWCNNTLTDLVGSFHVCRVALPHMIERGHGTIILFSGGGAAYGRPYFSAYGSSKAGVLRLVETIHEELKEYLIFKKGKTVSENAMATKGFFSMTGTQNYQEGIGIYAIAPGAVKTRLTEEILSHKELVGTSAYMEAEKTATEGGTLPEKAAELCLYLAQERPRCLSGRLIHVNEPYREYVQKFEGVDIGDSGLLRRQDYRVMSDGQ
jgi:NAD(P)-dependent dehydrogenase (short-subunit alcohol dehydrogenase family)